MRAKRDRNRKPYEPLRGARSSAERAGYLQEAAKLVSASQRRRIRANGWIAVPDLYQTPSPHLEWQREESDPNERVWLHTSLDCSHALAWRIIGRELRDQASFATTEEGGGIRIALADAVRWAVAKMLGEAGSADTSRTRPDQGGLFASDSESNDDG